MSSPYLTQPSGKISITQDFDEIDPEEDKWYGGIDLDQGFKYLIGFGIFEAVYHLASAIYLTTSMQASDADLPWELATVWIAFVFMVVAVVLFIC